MSHTDRSTVVATYIKNLIDTNKVALNVDNVLYGDHNMIPGGITVTVMPGMKNRTLQRVASPGAGTRNRMIVLVTVYCNETGDEQTLSLKTDQIAEAVEHLLHQNTTLGDNVIHGFVETWDPGYRFKTGSMYRATQMTHISQSKTNLTDIP